MPALCQRHPPPGARATQAPTLVEPAVKALDAALNALEETRLHLEAAIRTADFDPAELERNEERLFALRAAARKYNVPVDDLAALARKYNDDISLIDAGEARLKVLLAAAAKAEADFNIAAEALSKARIKARRQARQGGQRRTAAAEAGARQILDRDRHRSGDPPSRTASTASSSWVQTNPGTKPGPMMKIASGGELARFLLALKVVLADRGSAPTLVFDEIDTGVGGAVADAIGMRLARLGRGVQVSGGNARAAGRRARRPSLRHRQGCAGKRPARRRRRVIEVAADRRREEIARMLAGAEITNEARAAAERLIKAAS